MQKLMAIFAHPDDEGAIGGTLAHYVKAGVDVTLVCGTRGEVGEISDPALATPETLGEVRQKELEEAVAVLGIQHLEFLGYRDSGMVDTPENDDPRALVQAKPEAIRAQIADLMRQYQPDVVVTFEPFGWYGHPDHIAVGKWASEAFHWSGDNEAYASDRPVWQPTKLFHAVFPFSKFSNMIQEAIAAGYIEESDFSLEIPEEQQLKTEAAVTHIIDIAAFAEIKETSRNKHRTQFGEDSFFSKIPKEMMVKAMGHECFIQIAPQPDEAWRETPKHNLFD